MRYRFAASSDYLAPEQVASLCPGANSDLPVVIIRPGHASRILMEEIQRTGHSRWQHLPDSDRAHPCRIVHAGWQLMPPEALPGGAVCVPLEKPGRAEWVIREGHATPLLVAELTLLLTRMVRTQVWVPREAGGDAGHAVA
ncbi:hypothetical protein ACF068_14760 [Streptomyces sp. NPDC016309]|uniref:hypothetical protein n=1 Tax=Streptomyces sp. NPDC016309 TaxID=3364965 RepID=UPI0036FBBED6